MKKLLILTVLLFHMIPWLENGSLTFIAPYRLMAQSMGSESPFTAGNCTILCGAGSISGPCATVNSIPCDFVTVTPATNPPPPDPTTYAPPPSDPCSTNNPSYNPCNCGQGGCGGTSSGGGTGNTVPAAQTPKPVTPPATTPNKKAPTIDCGQLASILSDLVNNLRNANYTSPPAPPWNACLNQMKGQSASNDPNEHGIQLEKANPQSGQSYAFNAVGTGNPLYTFTNIGGKYYPDGTYIGTVALAHSHTKGGYTMPSAVDFFELANANLNLTGGGLLDSYVISGSEEINLHVSNPAQLAAFIKQYPQIANVASDHNFGGDLGGIFTKAVNYFKASGYSDYDAHTYAFTAVLNGSGVTVSRNTGSGYKKLNASVQTAPIVATITECK